jgi:hypothetical protein
MNAEIGTETLIFLFWEYLFRNFCILSLQRMRSSLVRMRSSLVVRASDCQCTSCNGPGFDPSIRGHSGIWGAADEAVLNIVRKKMKKSPKTIFKKKSVICTRNMIWNKNRSCSPAIKYIKWFQLLGDRRGKTTLFFLMLMVLQSVVLDNIVNVQLFRNDPVRAERNRSYFVILFFYVIFLQMKLANEYAIFLQVKISSFLIKLYKKCTNSLDFIFDNKIFLSIFCMKWKKLNWKSAYQDTNPSLLLYIQNLYTCEQCTVAVATGGFLKVNDIVIYICDSFLFFVPLEWRVQKLQRM